jgi:hypothetical protein
VQQHTGLRFFRDGCHRILVTDTMVLICPLSPLYPLYPSSRLSRSSRSGAVPSTAGDLLGADPCSGIVRRRCVGVSLLRTATRCTKGLGYSFLYKITDLLRPVKGTGILRFPGLHPTASAYPVTRLPGFLPYLCVGLFHCKKTLICLNQYDKSNFVFLFALAGIIL